LQLDPSSEKEKPRFSFINLTIKQLSTKKKKRQSNSYLKFMLNFSIPILHENGLQGDNSERDENIPQLKKVMFL